MAEELTPEQKREIRLANLAKGREKALAKRKEVCELKKKEKEMQLEERKKKIDERLKKVQAYEESKKATPPHIEEPPKTSKSKKQIKVELSDSSEAESSSESDSDESVEFVVERKPKKVSVKKVVKSKEPQQVVQPKKEPTIKQLSAEVAKQQLQKKLMDDAYNQAYRSLFPYHNF